MNLNIDITKELEALQHNSRYITCIIKTAEENWQKDTLAIKNLMLAVLKFLEDQVNENDKSYERAYVKAVICMQWYYITFSKYEEGTHRALSVYKICEQLNEYRDLMRLCNILLILYMKQGIFEMAIDYGLRGIDIADKYGEEKAKVTLVLNIMQLYIELKEYDRALQIAEYLEEKGYVEDERDEKRSLFIESALAEIKLHTGNLKAAMSHCEKAYVYALNQEDANATAELLYIRGQIQAKYNKKEKAELDMEDAIQISKENDYKEFMINGLISWSKEKLNQGIIKGVEDKLMEALSLAQEINAIYAKIQVYMVLEELYNQTGNWKEAYHVVKTRECYLNNGTDNSMWLARVEQRSARKELESYKRLYNQIQKISKVGQSFTANLEIDEMIDMIYTQVNELLPADIVGLGVRKKNGGFLYKVYGREGEGEIINDVNKELYERALSLGNMTLEADEDIIVNNGDFRKYFTMPEDHQDVQRSLVQSAMVTKLKIEDTPTGVIGIGNYKKNVYTQNDLRSLQILGSYLAVALRNADLFNEVEYLAMYDALTGIYNRGTVLKLGEEQFDKNKAAGKNTALIMLDIDYFKKINDEYGHIFGDKVIATIGKILKESIRNIDFLGRYGGEEFIVILSEVSLEMSIMIAKHINEKVSSYKFTTDKKEELVMTVSCGVYLCREEEDFDTGIKKADDALYEAKSLGRNRIVVYEENTKQER